MRCWFGSVKMLAGNNPFVKDAVYWKSAALNRMNEGVQEGFKPHLG